MPADRLLPRAFFDRPVLEVAHDLLGCFIEHETAEGLVRVRLSEVEAYDGQRDPGSHAFRGRTKRNAVMFGPPGHVYVYFSYGMHWCMNLVCGPVDTASAVLLRAGEVVHGVGVAAARRTSAKATRELARGPARLTRALGIAGNDDGADATDRAASIRVLPSAGATAAVRTGPRVGVAGEGASYPWRFWIDGDPTVSAYRPAISRRRDRAPSGTLNHTGDTPAAPPAEGHRQHAPRTKGPSSR